MIKPNYMEKLLEGVKVEWEALGEVCGFQNGFAFKSSLFKDNGLPIIRIANIDGKNIDLTNAKYFNPSDYKENTKNYEVNKGDILIAMSGATTGKIGIYDYKYTAYLNQRVGKFIPNMAFLNNRYLYHFLLSKVEEIYILAGGGAQPNLSSNNLMEKIQIPIPPLKVQEEIVCILDAFTELTAELTTELAAELTARKKQYTYYRDKLLTFDEGEVEWQTLGEVGELVRGNGLPKTDFTEFGIPAIHYGQIYTYYGTFTTETKSFVSYETAQKLKKVDTGDVVITNTSENLDDVGKAVVYLGKVQAVTGGHATIFKPSNHISGKYFAYFTQTEMFASQKRKYAKGTKVIDVSTNDMSKIIIPIPPLTEQERIVSILDKFDVLTSSISEGLPREIELRQKQYEYYRNLLLTFPKEEVEE